MKISVPSSIDNLPQLNNRVPSLLFSSPRRCSFSADGTYFASGSHDATVRIWSLGDDPSLRRASRVKTFCCTGNILSLDWINDQSFLFGTSQNEVRLVNVAGGVTGGDTFGGSTIGSLADKTTFVYGR